MTTPYRTNVYVEPESHKGHGFAANVKHVGSPTSLRFCACGAVIDENFHEVKTVPFKDWVKR